MNNALPVSCCQSITDLQHDFRGLFRRQLATFIQDMAEFLAVDVLHADEAHAIGDRQIINSHRVAVRDLLRKHEFLTKALQNFRTPRQFRANHFQRYDAIYLIVARLKH